MGGQTCFLGSLLSKRFIWNKKTVLQIVSKCTGQHICMKSYRCTLHSSQFCIPFPLTLWKIPHVHFVFEAQQVLDMYGRRHKACPVNSCKLQLSYFKIRNINKLADLFQILICIVVISWGYVIAAGRYISLRHPCTSIHSSQLRVSTDDNQFEMAFSADAAAFQVQVSFGLCVPTVGHLQ